MTDAADHASELPPVRAAFRFLVELAALAGWGVTGWQMTDGGARILTAVALPLAAAVLWGTFRVPGDRSAGSDGAIAVPGPVRLVVEMVVLLGAAVALAATWSVAAGVVLAVAVTVHYATTRRRVEWLLTADR